MTRRDGLEGARLVSRRHRAALFDSNGNAGPTVWWNGRWSADGPSAATARSCFGLLEDVGRDARAAIDAEVERLAAWIGDVRFSPGFLPPFQRGLAEA